MGQVLLQGKVIHLEHTLPNRGGKAPGFKLVGLDLKEKSLEDFKGKYKVLSFVPSLDTGVCSLSTKKFNEKLKDRADVAVCVISGDLPFAQKRWCGLENVTHVTPLSFFRSKDCPSSYGVLITEGPLEGLCARAVFVLNPKDEIVYYELVSEISQEPDYEKALAAL